MSISAYQSGEFKPTRKVTVYRKSELMGNIVKREMKLVEHGLMEYAQYKSAPFVCGVIKRKRSASRFVETFRPYMIIVEGWGNIEPNGLYSKGKVLSSGEGVTVTQGQYSSFDDGWGNDFDATIDKLIESGEVEVIADYRNFDSRG